ncbi:hypothetical protein C6P46_003099 [Rhodotorula mucilaginosa]|uniref:Uncharacterized protein n=1 Tax=Rhodotorula mucilaginosa TaxID=5537 RepID=A0A9P7B7T4_RHOMI|nr:hypothetical protein C6P46_003099 [Rhodotorula mucilaginosa]
MEPTKADHQEPKRLTMRQVVAQLVLVVPKRARKPGMDADPLIERLNTALLNLWSRPFYAFIESHRRTLSFKRASARFEDALHRLLSNFFKIRSADMTLGDKLRQLAQLLKETNFKDAENGIRFADQLCQAPDLSQIKIPSGALPERPCYKTWRDDFRLLALISALGLKSGKDVIADEEKNGAVFDQAKPGLHEEMRAWYDTMRHKLAAEYNSLSSDQACMWRQWNRDMWKAVTAVRQKVPDLDDDDGTRSEERRVLVAANFVSVQSPEGVALPHAQEDVHDMHDVLGNLQHQLWLTVFIYPLGDNLYPERSLVERKLDSLRNLGSRGALDKAVAEIITAAPSPKEFSRGNTPCTKACFSHLAVSRALPDASREGSTVYEA